MSAEVSLSCAVLIAQVVGFVSGVLVLFCFPLLCLCCELVFFPVFWSLAVATFSLVGFAVLVFVSSWRGRSYYFSSSYF